MYYKFTLTKSSLFFLGDIERVIDDVCWQRILQQTDHFNKKIVFPEPLGVGFFAPVMQFKDPHDNETEKQIYSDSGIFGVVSLDASMYDYIKKQYQEYIAYPPFIQFYENDRCFGMLIPSNEKYLSLLKTDVHYFSDEGKVIINDMFTFSPGAIILPDTEDPIKND